jgi:hypothetical protein
LESRIEGRTVGEVIKEKARALIAEKVTA